MDKNDKPTIEKIIKYLKKLNSSIMLNSDSNHYINPMNTYVYHKIKHYNLQNQYKDIKYIISITQGGVFFGTLLYKIILKRKISLNFLYPIYAIIGLHLIDNYLSYCFIKSNISSLFSLVKRDLLYQSICDSNDKDKVKVKLESVILNLYDKDKDKNEGSSIDLRNKVNSNVEIYYFLSDLLYAPKDDIIENNIYFSNSECLLDLDLDVMKASDEKSHYYGIKVKPKSIANDKK